MSSSSFCGISRRAGGRGIKTVAASEPSSSSSHGALMTLRIRPARLSIFSRSSASQSTARPLRITSSRARKAEARSSGEAASENRCVLEFLVTAGKFIE